MSRSELSADMFAAAAGSAIHLLRLQPAGGPPAGSGGATFGQVVVGHAAPVCSTRWNRNNKVVASGCADGQIQLLYSAGQVMAVLPRDGRTSPASMGTVTSLSWSMGSKRLAAGSDHGTVFIFEMGPSSAQVRPDGCGGSNSVAGWRAAAVVGGQALHRAQYPPAGLQNLNLPAHPAPPYLPHTSSM